MTRLHALWALAMLAVAPGRAAAPARTGAGAGTMVVIESRGSQRELAGGQTDIAVTESVWGDRRSIETDARLTTASGAPAVRRRHRAILALDRQVVWNLDLDDSSYTETSFALARRFAAAVPAPMKKSEKALGPGERIAGLPTTRFELRHGSPSTSGSAKGDSLEYVQDVWVGRGTPAIARVVAFEGRPQPHGAGLPAAAAEVARRIDGIPVRVITRVQFPKSFDMTALVHRAISDSAARSMGLDLETRSLLMGGAEVTSIRVAPLQRDRFEPPARWKKKPGREAEMLEKIKEGRPAAPGR
ncbi:MAG: hypothetical protein E6K80_05750 [Candidatus Eisenbacteria bacterium]|uniref:DUF4412 domain-containing protein n=1 Tax=Eiseniibacteriota bacterium TaxID=2212470 RepID=A0A538U673_UNCEI|nr:MAG: hypothetical protein E6K80_05750 [Candidatus Eisenbacteria bacterium]